MTTTCQALGISLPDSFNFGKTTPTSIVSKKAETPSTASDPGLIRVSHEKLRLLRPDLYGLAGLWKSLRRRFGAKESDQLAYIERQLQRGDSRAAVVISVSPLQVAAYTDEMDCIALLRFSDDFTHRYSLAPGSRLLTVNFYGQSRPDHDLIPGPRDLKNWTSFHPIIADFVSDDTARLQARKGQISEEEWERCEAMGREYTKIRPKLARDGRPVFAGQSAVLHD
jgi:hypothetical protein